LGDDRAPPQKGGGADKNRGFEGILRGKAEMVLEWFYLV
jgi:hypothetical protein